MNYVFVSLGVIVVLIVCYALYKKLNNISYKNSIDSYSMKWSEVIKNWKNGEYLKYPKKLKNSFYWETTPVFADKDAICKQKFIPDKRLNKLKPNYRPFAKHIKSSNNKYVVSFPNLSGDATLVIPMPRSDGRSYATLKDFMDNATVVQQTAFWKRVAQQIEKMLETNKKLWISTHGLGVHYLHVRISKVPKYYLTKSFASI